MQVVVVVAVTAHKAELVAAAQEAAVAVQETIPDLMVIIDNCQPVKLVTVNQELVVAAELAAITEAFRTGSAAKVALEL